MKNLDHDSIMDEQYEKIKRSQEKSDEESKRDQN